MFKIINTQNDISVINIYFSLLAILIIGVKCTGKAITISKLDNIFKSEGKKVIAGVSDTFLAVDMEQLKVWCDKVNVEIISGKRNHILRPCI